MALIDQYYATTRQELVTRITLRDSSFGGYLAFLAVALGVALKDGAGSGIPALAMTIPFISSAASVVVSQHHLMIGRLARYLQSDFLRQLEPSEPSVPFEASGALWEVHHFATISRTLTHTLIFQGSSFWVLWVTWYQYGSMFINYRSIWVAGLLLSLFSLYVTVHCEILRGDKAWRLEVPSRLPAQPDNLGGGKGESLPPNTRPAADA